MPDTTTSDNEADDSFGDFSDAVSGNDIENIKENEEKDMGGGNGSDPAVPTSGKTGNFGEFESSEQQKQQQQQQQNGDEYTKELKENLELPTASTDDFGSFEEATEVATTTLAASEVEGSDDIQVTQTDDFGSFEEAVGGGTTTTDTDRGKESTIGIDMSESFGNFESNNSAEKEDANLHEHQGTDAFSGFVASSNNNGGNSNNSGDFDDFERTGKVKPSGDDDFGDFDGATPSKQDNSVVVADDDDFGDFDGAGTSTQINNNNGDDDDDFGDFDGGDATKQDVAAVADGANGDSDGAGAALKQDSVVVADDDFGDFDGADSALVADDDFGDFDGAGASKQDAPVVAADDFGDFDGAGASKQDAAFGADDDFGDFDSAGAASKQDAVVVADDDFGDFDGPGAASKQDADANDDANFGSFDGGAVVGNGNDDDDDDFGDFDGAGASTPDNPVVTDVDDDFGDFGDGGPVKQGNVAVNHHQSQQEDPTLLKTRNVFKRVFNRFDSENSEGGNETDTKEEVITVQSLLSSIQVNNTEGMESAEDVLLAMLSETGNSKKGTGAPGAVVSQKGVGPNEHYAVPIGGSLFNGIDLKNGSTKKRKPNEQSGEQFLPDVLPIRLSASLKPSSTSRGATPVEPPTASSEATNGVANEVEVNGGQRKKILQDKLARAKETSTKNMQQLMEKIPDFSFMLKSKLSLPVQQKS